MTTPGLGRFRAVVRRVTVAEAAIAAIAAEEVISTVLVLPLQTLNHEHSAALDGTALKAFMPRRIQVFCRTATLAGDLPTGDAQITVGTGAGGTQLLPATALTGLNVVGESVEILLAGIFLAIAGNATLFAKVTTADTKGGACAITADVIVSGTQV